MKSLLFVYNPNSGKGLLKNKIADILNTFVVAGYMPTVYPTQAAGDGYQMVKDYKGHLDMIVCSGGDGTLDEIVTAVMDRGDHIPLGYIPSGSTNDFAKSLRIPSDMRKAADVAVNGEIFQCDIGKFNEDSFVYIAAFGMFTDVSYETRQSVKNVLGHTAYVLEGMKRLYNIPSYKMKITCDGELIEGEFLFGMVSNTRSVGGFKAIINDGVVFDDGVFEVMLIKKPDNIIELNEIVASLLIEQLDTRHMYTFQAHTIEVECEETPVSWTLDGEFGGEHHKVRIENCNKALDIMVEPKHKKSLMNSPKKTKPMSIPDRIKMIADEITATIENSAKNVSINTIEDSIDDI